MLRCATWILVLAMPTMAWAQPSVQNDAERNRQESDERRVSWPEPLTFSLNSTVGSVDFSDVRFSDSDSPLQMYGEQMQLSRVDLVGVEGTMGVSARVFRFAAGFGYYVPRGRGSTTLPNIGPNARLTQLHVSRWFVEAGIGHRFGNISPFLMLSGSFVRAIADVANPDLAFAGRRLSLGPRVGIRAHVYKHLFIQAALYADVLSFPDHTLTLGLGVGKR